MLIKQSKETKQEYLHAVIRDFWVFNRNHHIYTTIGNTYQEENLNTTDVQLLDDLTENNFFSGGFNNNVSIKFNDLFAGIHYKFKAKVLTFKQGLFLHNYYWKLDQLEITNKKKWFLLPNFMLKVKFSNSKKLQLNYDLKANFLDVSKFANRLYLQSYNSVFKGNDNLENELYHSARFSYSRFNLYKGLTLLANINYHKKIKGVVNRVDFEGVNRFVTLELLNNSSENFYARTNVRKKTNLFQYNFGVNYRNSVFLQQFGNSFVKNKDNKYSAELGVKTLFENFPTIEIGYKKVIGNYLSNNSIFNYVTNEPSINIEYDFLKYFVLKYNYYGYDSDLQGEKTSYNIADISLFYQKTNNPWNFKITVQNLMDEKFRQSNSFSDYLISNTNTFIMPRIALFTIGYKL